MKGVTSVMRAVCHFSCGATSAYATHIALKEFGPENCEILYADTGAEHFDNARFLKDCETKVFMGKKVTVVKSKKYNTIFDVFKERRFLASPAGAPCTTEMKKIPIRDYLGSRLLTERQVFGFDASEGKRINRYKENNPELDVYAPLYDKGISKDDSLRWLEENNIKLPVMYRLGFPNANCIGCVKAENKKYWAAIRKHFPEVFKWFADFERQIGRKDENGETIGAAINKRYIKGVRHRLFLDELPKDTPTDGMQNFWCGYSCGGVSEPVECDD